MAPFLRPSLQGLRFALSIQRERCLLKLPESTYVVGRWYGESAAIEDSNPMVNAAAGENAASSEGSSLPKGVGDVDSQALLKETSAMGAKQENAPPESSTDKLTSLILGKMRSRNASGSAAPPPQAGSASPKAAKPMEESKEPPRGDKWDQVMESMRNMAAKRKEQLAKGGAKTPLPKVQTKEDQDDFADLDDPAGELSKALSNPPSTDDAFKAYLSNSKLRESSFQASNMKPKTKETKTVSFSFLKALENDTPTPKSQSSGGRSLSDANVGLPSSSKPGGNGLQGSNQPMRKEAKPLSFEFLKAPDFKNGAPLGVQAKTNETARVFANNNKHELNTPPARLSSVEEAMRGSNKIKPSLPSGYTVCVHNLSSQSNLALIKEALSVHGEVVSSFKEPNANGSCSAFIEFKTADAMEDALATRWLQIDSKSFSIVRVDSPITTVVRLSRVSANATDMQVQAMCEKFGNIDQIRKRGNGVYDVFYKTGELSKMFAILDSLNEVTMNQRRWVAVPAPLLHPGVRREVLKGGEGQAWHAQQMSHTLSKLEMGLEAMLIHFEDLKLLVAMEDELTK